MPLLLGYRIEDEICTVTLNYIHARLWLLRNEVHQTGKNVEIAILQDMFPWSPYGKTLHGHFAPLIWALVTFSYGRTSKLRFLNVYLEPLMNSRRPFVKKLPEFLKICFMLISFGKFSRTASYVRRSSSPSFGWNNFRNIILKILI